MTHRKEIEALAEKLYRRGQRVDVNYDAEERIVSVVWNGAKMSPLEFSERAR